MGCDWRVGNGSMISLWDDAWLSGDRPCMIRSDRISGSEKVVELIDIDSGCWN